MTTVNIDFLSDYYTWDSCPRTWEQMTFAWENAGVRTVGLAAEEPLSFADAVIKRAVKNNKEQLRVADKRANWEILKKLEQTIGIADESRAYSGFVRSFAENIGVIDKLANTRGKRFVESISVAESVPGKLICKNAKEAIALLDKFVQKAAFHLLAAESIALTVKYTNYLQKPEFENIAVADEIAKELNLLKFEQVAFIEAASRLFFARPVFEETITIAEQIFKTISILKTENMALYDTIIQACRAVLSNIAISEGGMSLSEFEDAIQSAPGYTPFIDFKVGEYEYKEALIRLVVEAVVEQTEPSVSGVIMHVDIPDTQDRGTAEIEVTDAPAKIFFNKFFYNPPEVAVNLRGGNTGDGIVTPNIASTDKKDENGNRYFEVELLNASGQRVTGLITWQAVGY